jgi:hypothetical protein
MTIRKLMKIIEVVTNGGTVIVNSSTSEYSNYYEIDEFSEIEDIVEYDKNGGSFFIKDGDKPLYELEEIK